MNHLTDMELLARIDMTRSAIAEAETNLAELNLDFGRYLRELRRRGSEWNSMDSYRPKLKRLYEFILAFTCSSMPKKTASYRFVSVPPYKGPTGLPRPDPLEYQLNEENDVHMTVTFFVSTDELRRFVTAWWQRKFRDLNYIQFHPAE
jgi:hypothetical protein